MRVLVAGGTGFIGQAVVAELVRRGHDQVMSLSRSATGHASVDEKLQYVECDWRDAFRHRDVLEFAPDVVVNVLGSSHPRSSIGREVDEIEGAILPFFRLIDVLKVRKLRRVVFASSAGSLYRSALDVEVKERADSAYFSTKTAIEGLLASWTLATGLSSAVLRVSNPLGWNRKAGFGVVNHFSRAVISSEPVKFIGDYRNFKDYVGIEDVGRAFADSVRSDVDAGTCDVVDVGSGFAISAEGIYAVLTALSEGWEFPGELIRPSALRLKRTKEVLGWEPRVGLADAICRIFEMEKAAFVRHSG